MRRCDITQKGSKMFKQTAVALALAFSFAVAHATPAEYCQSLAANVQKELPSNQDEITRLVTVSCDGTVLHADFVVHDVPAGKNLDFSVAAAIVRKNVCNVPGTYLGKGVTSLYTYRDVNGNFIGQFTVGPGDCSNS